MSDLSKLLRLRLAAVAAFDLIPEVWMRANTTGDIFRISNDAEPFSLLLELKIRIPVSQAFVRPTL
jgi:hypothetical protein